MSPPDRLQLPREPRLSLLLCAALLPALALVGCGDATPEVSWDSMEANERRIQSLNPEIARLSRSAQNLRLPDVGIRAAFASQVEVRDLSGAGTMVPLPLAGASERRWALDGEPSVVARESLSLWRPLLDEIAYFEHGSFHLTDGRYLSAEKKSFETVVSFEGVAQRESGGAASVRSKQRIRWDRSGEGDEARWQIGAWLTESFEVVEAEGRMFREVLASAVPDREALARARTSIHEGYVARHLLEGADFKLPHRFFEIVADGLHPGIAVVDIDRDGFDDLYVMMRWGRNLFFRNRGDGTFEEKAAELGLLLENHSSSAIFADFDNDGDADVVVGRTLARSDYLVNQDGRFVERSDVLVEGPLPYFTSSVSAVDYDGDGLLDVYFSTYAPMAGSLTPDNLARNPRLGQLYDEHLPRGDVRTWLELVRAEDYHLSLNRPGPPNVLLHNEGGGRFSVVEDSALRVFRNTFQATWADYDGDGDADVYLANDFSPNNLFRNDGGGVFVDATEETGTADIGFGMGVTWGDYDGDLRQDLYVTNMHSNAGLRIMEQVAQLDERFPRTAEGNTLFRNGAGRFEEVSGTSAPALLVENAGWSWGGQFADFNNDGYLDLYALSGYFSSPIAPEIAVDL